MKYIQRIASRHMRMEATMSREPITAPTTRNVEQSLRFCRVE
jgi:hypothetical protein